MTTSIDKKMNFNKVDLFLLSSKHFNHKKYIDLVKTKKHNKTKYRYGFLKLVVLNFVVGVCVSNFNKNNSHYFKAARKYLKLKRNESIITYRTIKNKFGVSFEYLRIISKQLKELGILNHYKFIDSKYYVYSISDKFINAFLNKVKKYYLTCKQVENIDNSYIVESSFIIDNNKDHHPPDDDKAEQKIDWD